MSRVLHLFGQLVAALCVLAICSVASAAAHAPDWVKAAIAEADNWNTDSRAELLYKSETVRYTSSDFQHVIIEKRGVVRARRGGQIPVFASIVYHPNTGKIVSADGWTISVDGKTVTKFDRSDFTDMVAQYNKYFWYQDRILALDAAASLDEKTEYAAWDIQYEEQTAFRQWDVGFTNPLPCLREEFEAVPFAGGKIEWSSGSPRTPDPVAGSVPGALKWIVLKSSPRTADRPNGFIPDPMHVVMRCSPVSNGVEMTWNELSRFMAGFVDPQFATGGEVKTVAAKVIAGKSARWDRIRALTEFVQKDIVYLSVDLDKDSIEGNRPHPSEEVLKNRYGDCKDKATLLISMLRAVGENGRVVYLDGSRNPAYVNDKWPADYFDHVIVAISADASCPSWWPTVDLPGLGKFVIFDPTDPDSPLGILGDQDQGGFALAIDSNNGQLFRLPGSDPVRDRLVRQVKCTLDTDGGLSVLVNDERFGNVGSESHRLRANTTREEYQKILERRVDQLSPNATLGKWSDDWDAEKAVYKLQLEYSAKSYGRIRSNGMMTMSPGVYETFPKFAPWGSRDYGKVYLSSENFTNEIRISLPAGYKVEEMPDPLSEVNASASANLTYVVDGNLVVFTCTVKREGGFFDRQQYEDLRASYRKLAEGVKRPLLLVKDSQPTA